jgi:hypothetical protein
MAQIEMDYLNEVNFTGLYLVMFENLQKALAFYTYAEYLSFASASDGANGLQMDEKKSPKMWMVVDRQNKAMELGADMLEEVLRFLFVYEYSAFRNSDTYRNVYGMLVNSGDILKLALPASGGSYRFLLTLWPYLKNVEEVELKQFMGLTTYKELLVIRNGSAEGVAAGVVWLKLRRLAESLVAFVAYYEALPHLTVTVTADGGLRVLSEFDGIRNRNKVTDEQYNRLMQAVYDKREKLRGEIVAYLDANRGVFTDYATEMYKGANKPAFLENDVLDTIFGI